MDDSLKNAMEYLSAPTGSFWTWADDGKVVIWKSGATLAFREELAAVLERLKPRGLPSLDAVLLLIAAMRSGWPEDSKAVCSRVNNADTRGPLATTDQGIGRVFGLLDRIRTLPRDLIQTLEAKATLAEVVFEIARPVLTGRDAELACQVISHRLVSEHNQIPQLSLLRGSRVQTTALLSQYLWLLIAGLEGLTEESLRIRLKTGLEDVPRPAPISIPADPTVVRALLQHLSTDDELGGLCRLARNLSAVVQLPRALSNPDELPVGGVSDVANRGSLDRLLLSELAHDDLMLATRVALNEALYLRREAPPGQPPRQRYVLVDSGVRMWGVPRVFATSTMLSLAVTGDEEACLTAYRASGEQIVPIDLTSREGLTSHLEAMETEAHFGDALPVFFREVSKSDLPSDVVLVTCEAALTDAEFRQALAEITHDFCYVATVERTGAFALWSRSTRGMKCVTQLELDLDELLKPAARAKAPLIEPVQNSELPAIFRVRPLPFRVPYTLGRNGNKESSWSVRIPPEADRENNPGRIVANKGDQKTPLSTYGVLVLTDDRRLLLFDEHQRGGVQVADSIPFGTILWSRATRDAHADYALIYRQAEPALYLLIVDVIRRQLIASRKLASEFLSRSGPGSKIQAVTSAGGIMGVIYQSAVESFDMSDGRLLHCEDLPPSMHHSNRRYFRKVDGTQEQWCTLSVDGSKFQYDVFGLSDVKNVGKFITFFDWDGHGDTLGICDNGRVVNLTDRTNWSWTAIPIKQLKVIDIGADGNRVLVEHNSTQHHVVTRHVVYMDSRTAATLGGCQAATLAHYDMDRLGSGGTLMRRFSRIVIGTDDSLNLISKSQVRWQFRASNQKLRLQSVLKGAAIRIQASFEQARHPHTGCSMTMARFHGGSCAWIDSRGFLHLKSSDPMLPEVSMMMNEHDVAVWTSDGRGCSLRQLVKPVLTSLTPEEVMETILIPFTSRLL